jgi:GNAT superfamily N-acetyltransferase
MEIVRCDGPQEFLDITTAYRASEPLTTNVMGSVAINVIATPKLYDAYWWWVARNGETVVGAAMRTAPHYLWLGPMPLAASAELATAVAVHDDELPGIVGPDTVCGSFLRSYAHTGSVGSRRTSQLGREDLVQTIDELRPSSVEGTLEPLSDSNLETAVEWSKAFSAEVENDADSNAPDYVERVKRRNLFLWRYNGQLVSMAGLASTVRTPAGFITRVGPVYTPPKFRRHGYGGAVTGAVTALIMETGARAMLFSDAGNPTSNHVYRDLGYLIVDTVQHFDFIAPATI